MDFNFDLDAPTGWATDTTEHQNNVILDPPTYSKFFMLHGPFQPRAPVTGSSAALDELTLATDRDRLFVQRPTSGRLADVIKIAYQHLQRVWLFPQPDQIEGLTGEVRFANPVIGIRPQAQLLGIANATTETPPFKTRDVDDILLALRLLAQEFQAGLIGLVERPPEYAYSLGVVTMVLEGGGRPKFTAQLFASREGKVATGTLWTFRTCVGDGLGGHREEWRAFGDGTFDMRLLGRPDAVFRFHRQPGLQIRDHGAYDMLEFADMMQVSDDNDGDTHDYQATQTQHHHPNPNTIPDDVPDEQLFTHDPNRIRGSTILRLAPFYSNTELFERINAGFAAKNLPIIASSNVITRRITLALAKAARDGGLSFEVLRAELKEARKANGVNARMNARLQEARGAGRGRGEQELEDVGGGGGVEEEGYVAYTLATW